jgi:ABC-type iron transport system FetAB permease component
VTPVEAVKYQVLVAWMLLGATSLCAELITRWAAGRAFTRDAQLVLHTKP